MVDVTATVLELLRLYGPLALCLFTFLETSLLFPFLPSEVVVPAAAAVIITDPFSFGLFVLAATAGGTVGAYVPFYVFRNTRVGRADWLEGFIRISEDQIARGQEWFRKWGESSVLWGRILPFLRSAVSIPAGFADMQPVRFGAYTAVGTVAFYGATGAVVYYAREQSLFELAYTFAARQPGLVAIAAVAVVALAGLGWVAWNRRRTVP